jgi:hypothetical protein
VPTTTSYIRAMLVLISYGCLPSSNFIYFWVLSLFNWPISKKTKKNLKLCTLTQVFTPKLGYVTMKNYKVPILAYGLKRTTHWAKHIYDKVRCYWEHAKGTQ